MNDVAFGKNMQDVRKHRDVTLATTERRKNYLVPGPNYHTTKFFTEYLLAIEKKKSFLVRTFGMITSSQNFVKKQNCVIGLQAVLLYT